MLPFRYLTYAFDFLSQAMISNCNTLKATAFTATHQMRNPNHQAVSTVIKQIWFVLLSFVLPSALPNEDHPWHSLPAL